MSIQKCHWMVIVVNLGKQTLLLAWHCLLVWFCVCQVSIWYSRSSCDNRRYAFWHAGPKVSQVFYRDFWPFIHHGLAELTKILGRVVHNDGDCTTQFIPNMFYGVAVWRSCRPLHLGDVALLKKIKEYLSMVRCAFIALVMVVITKMLPGKWH